MSFQISPLNAEQFDHLYSMSPEQLTAQNIIERTASNNTGFPCRVSLENAEVGEKLLLVNFEHLPVDSPYRSRHAVYVRRNAKTAHLESNQIPDGMLMNLFSVRGFDNDGIMLEADVCEGTQLETAINTAFANPAVEYLHLHYAKAGCYAARVDRA